MIHQFEKFNNPLLGKEKSNQTVMCSFTSRKEKQVLRKINHLMPDILKQNCSFQLQVYLRTYDLLVKMRR